MVVAILRQLAHIHPTMYIRLSLVKCLRPYLGSALFGILLPTLESCFQPPSFLDLKVGVLEYLHHVPGAATGLPFVFRN
jgi:hypothetical protein